VEGADVRRWRSALELTENAAFKKVMLSLHYAANREELLASTGEATRRDFAAVFSHLWDEPVL
jgi:hypothetical protein